jgi:hypothetical protein
MAEVNLTYPQNGLSSPNTISILSFLIFTGLLVATLQPGHAQEIPGSLIKVGYLPYRFSKYFNDQYSLHLEYERSFRKAGYLSQGIGYDYIHYGQNQIHNILRYNLKFYPFYWLYGKRPYRGIYIGISPAFHWRKFYHNETLYGMGILPFLGTQFLIGNKVSLAFDMNMYAFRDLLKPDDLANQTYIDAYFSFRIGLKLGGRKK